MRIKFLRLTHPLKPRHGVAPYLFLSLLSCTILNNMSVRGRLLIDEGVTLPITPLDRGVARDGRVWVTFEGMEFLGARFCGMLENAPEFPGVWWVSFDASSDGAHVPLMAVPLMAVRS
jgi:hypothetical protein